jgi:hypothetical protein
MAPLEAQPKGKMQIKVYLVVQRQTLARPGEPNTRIIAARLTRSAAQEIVDQIPGTFIEKHLALK